jgi:hypothetical protein
MYLMALIFRLYGEKNYSNFSEAWMPLAYTMVIFGSSFYWGAIISKQLSINILQAQTPKEGEVSIFSMESYLLDVICARNVFAGMNLSRYIVEFLVHVYFSILWENRCKILYVVIYDGLVSRIYFIIFIKECPRLSATSKKMIAKVGHWYFEKTSTYIRVFGATGTPNLVPFHVSDRLILGEVCYQTILQGYNSSLVKDNKIYFIPYGFLIRFYMVKDIAQEKQEGLNQLEYWFPTGLFHKHYHKGLVPHHPLQVSSYWSYSHDSFEDEIFIEGTQDSEEVIHRRDNPNMTKFKVMSMDDKVETIE